MIRKAPIFAVAFAFANAIAQATDLNLTVRSGGAGSIEVIGGVAVSYEVVGVLTDTANEGLAAFALPGRLCYPGDYDCNPLGRPSAGVSAGIVSVVKDSTIDETMR